MKLSKTQQRALSKLTNEWQCGYNLQEKINTLEALVHKGLADIDRKQGSSFMPRNLIMFRKKGFER